MNIWHISQSTNSDYGTFSDAVVAAETEEEARKTHPDATGDCEWWIKPSRYGQDWATSLDQVSVRLIGKAIEGTNSGVICASFNPG